MNSPDLGNPSHPGHWNLKSPAITQVDLPMCIIHTIWGPFIIFYHGSLVPFKMQDVGYEQNLIQSSCMRRLPRQQKKKYQRTIDFIKCSQCARNGALALCSCLLPSLDVYLKATMLVLPILVMNRLRRGQATQGSSSGWTLRRSVLTFICL